jgi:NAD(P)-dependent dehydrogenase (short-subunit alcohol dehydrogenase family)
MLLTGASRGIGHATVRFFHEQGWRVNTVSRSSFAEDCPWEDGAEDHIQADLADPSTFCVLIAQIRARLHGNGLAAIVNNAGVSPKLAGGARKGIDDTSYADWLETFNINLFSAALLPRQLLPELLRAKGAIVNVTSIAGTRVHPFAGAAYACSKAALSALTREQAYEYGNRGIRVNAVSPGEIDTSVLSPGTERIVESQIPMRRLGSPDEVAEAIFFLCSEAASYINGATLEINGGQHV